MVQCARPAGMCKKGGKCTHALLLLLLLMAVLVRSVCKGEGGEIILRAKGD